MKNKGLFIIALIIALLLKVFMSKAQDTIRLSVHFDYGKSELLPAEVIKLDSLFAILKGRQVSRMCITGNTDVHGSHQYNLDLSDSRARTVYDYFAQKGISVEELLILGQGKTLPMFPGEDEISRAGNRRTDIEMVLLPPEPAWTQLLKHDSLKQLNDTSSLDITYLNGIRLLIPSGLLAGYPNGNLKFRPECNTDIDQLHKMGYTTMTANGEVLASTGIFCPNMTLKNGTTIADSTTFAKPLEAWVLVSNCTCLPGNVVLWDPVTDENQNIVWMKNKDSIRIERLGLKKYYVFPVRTLTCINLDCPLPTKSIKLAFRHYQPVSVKLVYPRTKAIIVGKKSGKSIMTVPMLSTKEVPKVYAVASDDEENIYKVNGKRFSYLKQNPLSGRFIFRKQDFRKANPLKIKKVNKEEVIFGALTE